MSFGCSNAIAIPPFLLPHLFECVSNIKGTYFLLVLKFEKLVSAMPSHVDKDV